MSDSSPPHAGPVGTLAEEALKLIGTLAAGADHAPNGHRAADAATDTGHGPDCTYCPVCQLIGYVRHTSPETRRHLNASVESLTLAVRGIIEAVASHPPRTKTNTRRDAGVENIDLSEDEPWD